MCPHGRGGSHTMSNTDPMPTGHKDWCWSLVGCRWFLYREHASSTNNLAYIAPREGAFCVKMSSQRLSDIDFRALSRIVLAKLQELEGGAA